MALRTRWFALFLGTECGFPFDLLGELNVFLLGQFFRYTSFFFDRPTIGIAR
jgi:hypothetical protein